MTIRLQDAAPNTDTKKLACLTAAVFASLHGHPIYGKFPDRSTIWNPRDVWYQTWMPNWTLAHGVPDHGSSSNSISILEHAMQLIGAE